MKICVAIGQNVLFKHVSKYLHSGFGAFRQLVLLLRARTLAIQCSTIHEQIASFNWPLCKMSALQQIQ